MKKTKLFTFIIILTLVMPTFQVYAAESKDGTEVLQIAREYIISKAIEAFPEYSSKIQGENELALILVYLVIQQGVKLFLMKHVGCPKMKLLHIQSMIMVLSLMHMA